MILARQAGTEAHTIEPDAERLWLHSHAERGNDQGAARHPCFLPRHGYNGKLPKLASSHKLTGLSSAGHCTVISTACMIFSNPASD